MIQGRTELTALLEKSMLVEGYIDAKAQTQVNGFELTVKEAERFYGAGRVGFDNADRVLPDTKGVNWSDDGWAYLEKGCYKVIFNEIVSIPKDMCAIGLPRSSLLRAGVSVHTAVWDAGYRGRSEALLVVYNDHGFYLKKDARLIQLMFMRLETAAAEGYSGQYMNENIPK